MATKSFLKEIVIKDKKRQKVLLMLWKMLKIKRAKKK